MCKLSLIILFLFNILIGAGTKAQESLNYSFRHITQSDGLLHNLVLSITQDGKGFIWVATPNGLQRYDGSRFIYYPDILSNAAERLTSSAELYADKTNNILWITNNIAVEKMQLGKNNFTVYEPEKLLTDSSIILNSYRDINNLEWILGRNMVYYYDSIKKTKGHSNLNILPANAHKTSYIATDSVSNTTWVASSSELLLFDKKTRKVYSDNFNPIDHPLLKRTSYGKKEALLRFIMIDSRQNIWVTSWKDILYKYDPVTKQISTYSLSAIKPKTEGRNEPVASPLINCMLEDDHHNIWIGTENAGLLRYNKEKENFDYIIARDKNRQSIQYNYKIFSLFQDKEQNIWIGTDRGISIFNPYRQYFTSLRHEENNPLSIGKSEIISFIQATTGDMFIGTWGAGIAVYDSRFNFKKNIRFTDPGAGADNDDILKVWSFQQVDENTLWIGCQHGKLIIYNMLTGSTQYLQPPEMEESTIVCMEKDDKGNIWFGLHNGKISKWDRKLNKFFSYGGGLYNTGESLPTITNIFIDRAQLCWVSTISGFKQFDLEKMLYNNTWLPDKNNKPSFSGKTSLGIEEYNDSILLIGTAHGGLNFFNKNTHSFSNLGKSEGLPSNTIYAIKKDITGYIWFTTDYGLYKFYPAEKKIISYSMDPGIIRSSFTANKFYPLQNGQWLSFTIAEAISFSPGNIEYQDKQESKIEITGFKLFDKPLFIDSLLFENKPVRLSYKENFFTVEFAELNFSGLHQPNYYYRLIGIDKNWVNGGTNRFANYTDLQPGEYTFTVRTESGNSSSATTSFKIIIAPPFWKTWWFISAICICIILLVYAFIKWRERTLKEMYSMNEQLSKAKLEALRAQMNPHFIFNCLNSIDNLIQMDEKEKATLYLSKFARLIRSILESATDNVIACWKDMETLELYLELEALRFDNKFSYHITISDEILNGDYKVPPLVIQPFVENAIHHGLLNKIQPDKKLLVDVSVSNNHIHYRIEDNGVGRKKAAAYKLLNKPTYESMGMQITTERINLFNQHINSSLTITDLHDEQGSACGTKVEVELVNHS